MAVPKSGISFKFEKKDIWIGCYWNIFWSGIFFRKWIEVYICLLPCLPIKIVRELKPNRRDRKRGFEK